MNPSKVVTPVKTEVQGFRKSLNRLDSGVRRNDRNRVFRLFTKLLNLVYLKFFPSMKDSIKNIPRMLMFTNQTFQKEALYESFHFP